MLQFIFVTIFGLSASSQLIGAPLLSALDDLRYLNGQSVFIVSNNKSAAELTSVYANSVVTKGYSESFVWEPAKEKTVVPLSEEYYSVLHKIVSLELEIKRLRQTSDEDLKIDLSNFNEIQNLTLTKLALENRFLELGELETYNRPIQKLRDMLVKSNSVDIFIFEHTNGGEYLWLLKGISEDLRKKVRLVYNSGCRDLNFGKEYVELGVGAFVGHTGNSYSPLFINSFQSAWKRGHRLFHAVEYANQSLLENLNTIFGVSRATSEKIAEVYFDSKGVLLGNRNLQVEFDRR